MAKKRGLGNPMVAMAADDAAKNMTPTQKMLLIGGSLVVVGGLTFIGYKIYKGITGSRADDVKSDMSANLRDYKINRSELTINEDIARNMAQLILDAMNQKGTDEKTILDQLEKLKSKSDLLYVLKAFDIHNYGMWGEADTWAAKKLGYATPLNMSGWFKKEFSQGGDSYKKIEAIYRNLNIAF